MARHWRPEVKLRPLSYRETAGSLSVAQSSQCVRVASHTLHTRRRRARARLDHIDSRGRLHSVRSACSQRIETLMVWDDVTHTAARLFSRGPDNYSFYLSLCAIRLPEAGRAQQRCGRIIITVITLYVQQCGELGGGAGMESDVDDDGARMQWAT